MNTYRCIHDTNSVGSNRISDVANIDGIEGFVIGCSFKEDLVVEVVVVTGYKDMNISHNLQYVDTLSETSIFEERRSKEMSHFLLCLYH